MRTIERPLFWKPGTVREMYLQVNATPPSVSQYKRYDPWTGMYYLRSRGVAWLWAVKNAVWFLEMDRRCMVFSRRYKIRAVVYLGKGRRGGLDNFDKMICGALQGAGAIPNDGCAKSVEIVKERDWDRPRTEITITVEEGA